MYSNVFYFDNINSIGGVETFFYYLAKKYHNLDITVVYSNGDEQQLKRLSKLIRVIKFTGQKIKCKKVFFNYSKRIIDYVDAEEYGEIFHGIPERKEEIHPKITHLYGVSQVVCDAVKKMTGRECTLVYNPVDIDKPKKILKLISATRLSAPEKGKDRMIILSKILEDLEIPYVWYVFTNDINEIDNSNIIYMKPSLDITSYIQDCDFLVQLSSTEAFCYSVVESLSIGKPVIVTDLPVYKEIGLNENNSIILDLNFDTIDKDKLFKEYKFTYTPPKDSWDKILVNKKTTYDPNNKVKVECIEKYWDNELKKDIKVGEPLEVSYSRYLELIREPALVKEVT